MIKLRHYSAAGGHLGPDHPSKKGRLMTCPGLVSLQVLEPIPTAGLSRDSARELADRVRDALIGAGLTPADRSAPAA